MASLTNLAIALVICKSKPNDLSIREYILELRKHIRPGKRPELDSYLDTAMHWRALYERCEQDKLTLEGKVLNLENQVKSLKSQLEDSHNVAGTGSKKRKADHVSNGSKEPSAKRAKGVAAEAVCTTKILPTLEADCEIITEATEGQVAATCIHHLHSLCHEEPLDVSRTALVLAQACEALALVVAKSGKMRPGREIAAVAEGLDTKKPKSSTAYGSPPIPLDLSAPVRAIRRSIPLLLLGINKLSDADTGREYLGGVVHAFVTSYKTILDVIGDVSERSAAEDRESSRPSSSKQKALCRKAERGDNILYELGVLLHSFLLQLTVGNPAHRELFEGFAFVVFERVAQILHHITFGHSRFPNIEDEISTFTTKDQQKPGQDLTGDSKKVAIKIESQYLIPLFERCTLLASLHFAPPSTRNTRSKSTKSGRIPAFAGKSALSIHIRERLQQTLVNCIFQTDHKADDFMDCLRMPMRAVPLPLLKNTQENDTAKWFTSEAWRIIGWEVLGKESDW